MLIRNGVKVEFLVESPQPTQKYLVYEEARFLTRLRDSQE
jgi:hypothetical protein